MSHNTWIHRIVRVGVKPLANTAVTPNQITSLRLAAGMGAAALFATGPSWNLYAAALFVLSMLLDRADGELARIADKTSPWGHTYDLLSDGLSNMLVFIGIGIGLRHGAFGPWSVAMGIAAGSAVAFILWLVMRIESLEGARATEFDSIAGFDPDDAMLAIPLAALLGWTEPLLVAAGIGAPAFALFVLWRFRTQLRASPE